jgi:acetyl esterase/lipase
MKIFADVFIIVALVLTLMSCSNFKLVDALNAPLSSAHYEKVTNLAYGTDARQMLDIYYPTATTDKTRGKNKPIIVFVYGGAWTSGEKKDYLFIAHALTQAGYRVVIPDYRLYPAVKFPLFIDDIADAIAYLDQQKTQLFTDVSQGIVLMGHSAGAHTVALLATDQRYFKRRNIQIPLVGLIALAGPYDLQLDDPEVIPIFLPVNDTITTNPTRMVHSKMPPVLLLHGQKDTRVKPFHTENFAQALQQQTIPHTVKRYKKVSHINILISIASPLRYLNPSHQDILAFLATLRTQKKQ